MSQQLKLTEGQRRFARALARKTGLNSRVISAWMLAEESGGAARSRQKQGNHNWLNIGYFDAGPGAITKDAPWRSPEKAAEATAQFLRGEKYGASAGIRRILKAGSDPRAQIAAIGRSGWATNPQYGSNIRQLFGQAPAPGAASGPDRGRARVSASPSGGGGAPVDGQAQLGALRALFDQHNVLSFAQQMGQLRAEAAASTPPREEPSPGGGAGTGSPSQGSHPASDLIELFYDPLGGWKRGQSIGPIGNHSDHVHVASGPRQLLRLGKLAQDMGLHVGENPAFGDKVDPVHVQGSNHYRKFRVGGRTVGGALDISGDPKKMRAYTLRVKRMYGVK